MAARNERGVLEEAQAWFESVPPVTRALFAGMLGFSLAAGLSIVSPYQLLFVPDFILKKYQLWRLVTAFLWQPLGFAFLMNLYFFYRNSNDLETGLFVGRTADYVTFIVFTMVTSCIAAYFLELVVLFEPMMMAVVYVWASHNSDSRVSFLFGIQFKALYLPWALVAMDVFQGNPYPITKLLGIAVGFLYYYLDQTFPRQNNGRKLLVTPQIFYKWFPPAGAGVAGGAGAGYRFVPPVRPAGGVPAPRPGSGGATSGVTQRHTWGSGNRLGTD
ncbi:Derlin 1 [Geranomyces michiganensis]|nr:Derlin 1 [Geranomyces michiganensis]